MTTMLKARLWLLMALVSLFMTCTAMAGDGRDACSLAIAIAH